jgi:(2Fe-2S) ferredoxin
MSHYAKHVFFCENQRPGGEDCCANHNAKAAKNYVKDKVKMLGISTEKNLIRINSAGCLGRCDLGPVMVVYPEAVWYTYIDQADLDEIIEEHLTNGNVVERLKI